MGKLVSDLLEAIERNRQASILIVIFLLASLIVCVAGCVCVFVFVANMEADPAQIFNRSLAMVASG